MPDVLTDNEKSLLRATFAPGNEVGAVIRRVIDRVRTKAQKAFGQAKINCENIPDDIRYCMGVLKGLEEFEKAIKQGDINGR